MLNYNSRKNFGPISEKMIFTMPLPITKNGKEDLEKQVNN